MIEFTLDGRSGVSPYLQVVHQVRQALRLGVLREGGSDRLLRSVGAEPAALRDAVSPAASRRGRGG